MALGEPGKAQEDTNNFDIWKLETQMGKNHLKPRLFLCERNGSKRLYGEGHRTEIEEGRL